MAVRSILLSDWLKLKKKIPETTCLMELLHGRDDPFMTI